MLRKNYFFLGVGGAHPMAPRTYSWLSSKYHSWGIGETDGVLGIESRLAVCKASTHPTAVLSQVFPAVSFYSNSHLIDEFQLIISNTAVKEVCYNSVYSMYFFIWGSLPSSAWWI